MLFILQLNNTGSVEGQLENWLHETNRAICVIIALVNKTLINFTVGKMMKMVLLVLDIASKFVMYNEFSAEAVPFDSYDHRRKKNKLQKFEIKLDITIS